MVAMYGLDIIFNNCQASSFALTSDTSQWADERFYPELLMSPSLYNGSALIRTANF